MFVLLASRRSLSKAFPQLDHLQPEDLGASAMTRHVRVPRQYAALTAEGLAAVEFHPKHGIRKFLQRLGPEEVPVRTALLDLCSSS